MAVVNINPRNWDSPEAGIDVVQVDSNAEDNTDAILEIDRWAAEHEFARTTEYWLRQVSRADGVRVFRGICFRLTEEERRSTDQANRSHLERMKRMPVTAHRAAEDR